MNAAVTSRMVPARRATFRLVGRTNYTTLFGEMFYPANEIAGEIAFTPQANEFYVVKGTLGRTYSAIWIEDSAGAPVAAKIEIRRAAR